MAYSAKVKEEVIEQMKTKKIPQIAKETGISPATLYNWKKEEQTKQVELEEKQKTKENNTQQEGKKYYNQQEEDFNYRQGKAYFKLKKYKYAKEYFLKSIKFKGSECNKSTLYLGKIYVLEKKYEEARKEFKKYIEIDRDKKTGKERTPHARLELGKLDVLEGKYEEAREEFERCIEIDEKDKHAHLELGKLDVLERKYEEARKEFETCIEIDEDRTPHARLELGKLDALEEKYEDARKEFERCLEIDKKDRYARLELERLDKIHTVSNTAQSNVEQGNAVEEKNNTKIEQPVTNVKTKSSRKKEKVYISSEDIAKINPNFEIIKKQKKKVVKNKKVKDKKETINQKISTNLKQVIDEINCKYYVLMQPQKINNSIPKEYYDLLQDIRKTNQEEKNRRMKQMKDILKGVYGNNEVREKYIKKYDKLQSILECSSDNKRAQMELILILINEGYSNVAQVEFKENYEYIEKLIEQYKQRKMTANEVKDSIDEYCI